MNKFRHIKYISLFCVLFFYFKHFYLIPNVYWVHSFPERKQYLVKIVEMIIEDEENPKRCKYCPISIKPNGDIDHFLSPSTIPYIRLKKYAKLLKSAWVYNGARFWAPTQYYEEIYNDKSIVFMIDNDIFQYTQMYIYFPYPLEECKLETFEIPHEGNFKSCHKLDKNWYYMISIR